MPCSPPPIPIASSSGGVQNSASSNATRANKPNGRSNIPTARKRSGPGYPKHHPQPEPINVDAEYERKYVLQPDELIEPIDAATYRQSVRESRERSKSKGKERQQSTMNHDERISKEKSKSVTPGETALKNQNALHRSEANARPSTPLPGDRQRLADLFAVLRTDAANNTEFFDVFNEVDKAVMTYDRNGKEIIELAKIGATAVAVATMLPSITTEVDASRFPSVIGPAIAQMKRNRSMAPQQQSATPNKQRRLDSSASTAKASQAAGAASAAQSAIASSSKHQQQPVAGPSRSQIASNAIIGPSQHKRKPAEADGEGDDPDIMVLSDSTSVSVRKRPRLASTSRQPSVSSRIQTQANGKRVHDVIELSSDGEVVEMVMAPPKKKTKVAIPSHNVPPQDSVPIEISSDSEDYNFDFGGNLDPVDTNDAYIPSPILKPKVEQESSDDDEDDEWPPGFDLNDPDKWKPLNTAYSALLDNSLSDTLEQLNIADPRPPSPPVQYIPPDTSMFDPRPRRRKRTGAMYVWDMLAQAVNVRVPPRPRPAAYQVKRPYMPPWKEDFDLYRMKRAFYDPNGFYELKKAPGSINRVVQKGSWTVIASVCLGGLPDVPDEEPCPHNREGSLMTLHHELDIPKGHEAKKFQPPRTKYYAVNDVQFDPLRKAFVSSGADCRLRLWSLQDDDEEEGEEDPNALEQDSSPRRPRWTNRPLKPYKNVPHDLAFKPQSSILAVAEKQIRFYSLSQSLPEPLGLFSLYPGDARHIAGAMAWGMDSTSNHLFASSEPLDPSIFEGIHKVYDIQQKQTMYTFDAKEAGDTLCVGPTGSNLALATRGQGSKHILRLYDIARRDATATSTVHLEPFPVRYPGFEGEVNSSMFSPDGLFLALARNDNQTHVYDMRYTYRGPLYRFEHTGECQASDKGVLFGVVKAQWLQSARSRRIALVTGGEDGCVRVWDPNLSAEDSKNGLAIAQVNSDVGHFSLGDPFVGEHRLVVGDCSGEISVFNNHLISEHI